MPKPTTTPGQLMLRRVLPEDMRQPSYDLDKKSIKKLLQELAERHPDRFKDVAHQIMKMGHFASQSTGLSIGLRDFLPPEEVENDLIKLRKRMEQLAEDPTLDNEAREKKAIAIVGKAAPELRQKLFDQAVKRNNRLALQAKSGARGNPSQLASLLIGDMLVQNHRDQTIGVPILHGYAEGLDPVEYFAGSYGARKGVVDLKDATPQAGYFGKTLSQASHRQVITMRDCGTRNGIETDSEDEENIGAVRVGGDQPLTARDLASIDDKKITLRSPMTCEAPDGLCSKCAGARESGKLPDIGDNVGLPSAQSVSEKVSQMTISSKHSGGTVGAGGPSKGGFDRLNQLAQVPSNFRDAAPLVKEDGTVTAIKEAPQGGHYVSVGAEQYYVPAGQEVTVKAGQTLEAGDALSNGIPNPREVARHKGIGEGRRYFLEAFKEALSASGQKVHRRNLETLSRSLVNHVRITDPDGYAGYLPDDTVPYDTLRAQYQPREGASARKPQNAIGQYLERPALHYSLGTRVTPSVAKRLQDAGMMEVQTHPDPPPFEPQMVRAVESATRDPNWLTRMSGSYLSKGFLDATHRGMSAPLQDTSYVPGLVQASDFGSALKTTGKY